MKEKRLPRKNLSNFSQDWVGTKVIAEIHISDAHIDISYTVDGLKDLLVPSLTEKPQFREGLWQHTCFEFFLRPNSIKNYLEFNFSPSGDWAVFAFSGYRSATESFDASEMVLGVHREIDANTLLVKATLDRAALARHFQQNDIWEFRGNLTAVLESHEGKLTYWALTHGKLKPDFHLPETFTLPLRL